MNRCKKWLLIQVLFLWLLSVNSFATDVSWAVSGTWTLAESPYVVISDISLASGSSLVIEPGVVVKFNSSRRFTVNGNLQAVGLTGSEIVFTSIKDDSVGGDTNEDGSGSSAGKWDWDAIRLKGAWSNGTVMEYVEVKYGWQGIYGGYRTWRWWIYIENSNGEIRNSVVTGNLRYWIYINGWIPTIENNMINDNGNDWIYINSWTPTVENNTIRNNWAYWIYAQNIDIMLGENANIITWNVKNAYYAKYFEMSVNSGTINDNWYDIVVWYDSTIWSWKTLTIKWWNIIKMNNTSIIVEWNLQAIWTSSKNILFTSINDNSVGEELWTWTPSRWDWDAIRLTGEWSNESVIEYVEVKYWWRWIYGGYRTWRWWIYIENSNGEIRNSVVTGNLRYWIYINGWIPTIENNMINDNGNDWIYINSWTPTVENNTIRNNWAYWIYAQNIDIMLGENANIITWNVKNAYYAKYFEMSVNSGTINDNWYDIVVWYDSTIWSWKTLTIKWWNIIKMNNTSIIVEWNLQAIWTSSKNILFTSINDNSVGEELWTWTPSRWDWDAIRLTGEWSNESVIEYVEVKYWWRWIYGGYRSWWWWIYIENSNGEIRNSVITEWNKYWIYVSSWTPTITNTILTNNTNYWIYCSSWTPTIKYNLFYQNTAWDQSGCTLWSWNLLSTDPQFITGTYLLQWTSPAINAWDPALWNHPLTNDRYDIWVSEYTNLSVVNYTANITNTENKTLTYTWSFTQDPSSWNDIPLLTNDQWSVTSSATISTNFIVKYIGSYTVKLVIKEGETELLNKTSNFTVVN